MKTGDFVFAFLAGVFIGVFAIGTAWLSGAQNRAIEYGRRHELWTPLCAKERSALECEALWQGIEVKP